MLKNSKKELGKLEINYVKLGKKSFQKTMNVQKRKCEKTALLWFGHVQYRHTDALIWQEKFINVGQIKRVKG